MSSLNRALAGLAPLAPLVLRIVLGVLFVLHGIDKFSTGISNVEGFFDSNGVPAAGLAAPLTAVAEIVFGGALIAGIATRLSALALSAVIIGAIIFVKNDAILGSAELDLAYLAGLVTIAFIGPGALSVDHVTGMDNGQADRALDLRTPSNGSSRRNSERVGA